MPFTYFEGADKLQIQFVRFDNWNAIQSRTELPSPITRGTKLALDHVTGSTTRGNAAIPYRLIHTIKWSSATVEQAVSRPGADETTLQ